MSDLQNSAYKVITLDGPSGSGKGTISRLIAQKIGFELLDSGAIYRLTALHAHNQNVNLDDESSLSDIAQNLDITFVSDNDNTRVLLCNKDVTRDIRDENIGMIASKIAAYTTVRNALLKRQRDFLTSKGLIADGRDMGTVVFPNATLKIFLTASSEVRAQRRMQQLARANVQGDYANILRDIQMRDDQDRNRKVAPLVPAKDAHSIDCSNMEIKDVLNQICALIKKADICFLS